MARNQMKKTKKSKAPAGKQGHKLVVLTLVIILIPCAIVGFVLITSIGGQNKPVVGDRFSKHDLQPRIEQTQIKTLEQDLLSVGGVEEVTINLKSATLRIGLNLTDDVTEDAAKAAVEHAFTIVNEALPVDEYFTNKEDGKMYDMEIDAYNYIVDDQHPQEGFAFVKLTKTGASATVIDVMSSPKNPELAQQVKK